MLQITTLNLNGIRSATRKGLADWLEQTAPDFLCVQELKAQQADMAGTLDVLAGMPGRFQFAEKRGYSGVGIYSRHEPSDVKTGYGAAEFDAEGRYVELRFDTSKRKFSIISCYFPSGSSGEERQQAKYRFLDDFYHVLERTMGQRDFVLCGDLNIAHHEIDLKNWRGNRRNSGFLPLERAWMSRVLGELDLCDVYRQLHPDTEGEAYTWWSNRGRAWDNNVGWRLDYHLATRAFAVTAQHCAIYKDQRFSDHAPLTVAYDWSL